MIKRGGAILLGSACLGVGVNGFILPYHLMEGGMIGLGLLAKYLWGFETGLTIIIASIPVYILAWFYYRSYFYNSLHGLLISSFFIDLFAPLSGLIHLPLLLSAVIGGAVIGCGAGIMMRNKVSTGGIDLLALFISMKTSINVGVLIFLFDAAILISAAIVISPISLLYSTLTISSVALFTIIWTYSIPDEERI